MNEPSVAQKYADVSKAIAASLRHAGFRKTGRGFLKLTPQASFGVDVVSRPRSTPDCKRFAIHAGVWWKRFDKYALMPPEPSGWPGDLPDRSVALERPPEAAGEDALWHLDASTDLPRLVVQVSAALAALPGRLERLGDLGDFEAELVARTREAESVTIVNVRLLRLLVESGRVDEARSLCAAWQGALRPGHYKIEWLAGQWDEVLRRHAGVGQ
jgi:hypothetical protein